MKEKFEIREFFNVSPSLIYHAWLDSIAHTAMTGGEAECSKIVDEDFSAWDGYIWGKNVKLVNNQEIVQSWRTVEFMEEDEDSIVTILLKKVDKGTELTLKHTNIPKGQTQYEEGWKEHYFEPMKTYFGNL